MPAKSFTSPSVRSFTKDQLTPVCLETFGLVKAALPPALADRLRSNRLVVTHGSYRDLCLFDIWDAHQSDVLPKRHATYCLNYCQHRKTGCPQDGELHLWLNTILMRKLAWGIQARERGDISPAARKRAHELADLRHLRVRMPRDAEMGVPEMDGTRVVRRKVKLSRDPRIPSVSAVSFTARHYSNDGVLKDLLDNSFYTVAFLDSGVSVMESHSIEASVSANNYTVPFKPGNFAVQQLPNQSRRHSPACLHRPFLNSKLI